MVLPHAAHVHRLLIDVTIGASHLAMSTNAEVVMFFSLSCTTVAPPNTAAATT